MRFFWAFQTGYSRFPSSFKLTRCSLLHSVLSGFLCWSIIRHAVSSHGKRCPLCLRDKNASNVFKFHLEGIHLGLCYHIPAVKLSHGDHRSIPISSICWDLVLLWNWHQECISNPCNNPVTEWMGLTLASDENSPKIQGCQFWPGGSIAFKDNGL